MHKRLNPLCASLLPSRQLGQIQRASETYLSLPDNDLLHGFRQAADMPAPGKSMGGWCGRDSSVIFGQVISGLARLGATTGNADAIAKAAHLFECWRQTAGLDGDARMGNFHCDSAWSRSEARHPQRAAVVYGLRVMAQMGRCRHPSRRPAPLPRRRCAAVGAGVQPVGSFGHAECRAKARARAGRRAARAAPGGSHLLPAHHQRDSFESYTRCWVLC